MVTIWPEVLAITVALLATLGEGLHLRRIARIKRLAFGPREKPALWTWLTPVLRVSGLALACWGFASLWLNVQAQVHNKEQLDDSEFKHLVLVVDVSPSMHLTDAGPEGDRTRRQRASDILESLFNRIPMRQFRITIIAVYTDAKMMLEDSQDHEIVRHIMEEMPMWHAFEAGRTKLLSGIIQAAKTAKSWNPGSTYILMLTDGDTVPTQGMPKLPPSVIDFFVVGVGDPNNGSFIDGHQSRQDVNTLRQIANRLRGAFHNGNEKHLTSQFVGRFTDTENEDAEQVWSRREWALMAAVVGSGVFSLIPVLLHYFGTSFTGGTIWNAPGRLSTNAGAGPSP